MTTLQSLNLDLNDVKNFLETAFETTVAVLKVRIRKNQFGTLLEIHFLADGYGEEEQVMEVYRHEIS